jgi:hypothetical protein
MQFDLATSKVVGFYSLPAPSLAEHNPTAYNNAIADAPKGAGTCQHCGTPIMHHVIIRTADGKVSHVGTSCADKCGVPRELVKYRMTSEAAELRRVWLAERASEIERKAEAARQEREASIARRAETVGDIVAMLEQCRTEFHSSLAKQLREHPLSRRQATFVCKATSATGRRNKKNAAAWDDILDRCTAQDE